MRIYGGNRILYNTKHYGKDHPMTTEDEPHSDRYEPKV